MALNFNVEPYYDDFDPAKNFHRILFKPGYAVQARELTQSQTILQNQISEFASSIFSQNTPISGGKITTNLTCKYLKLNTLYNGQAVVAENFLNKIIQDSTGTILAQVIATAEATGLNGAGDPPTLIVSYLSGGEFKDNMVLTPTDGTNIFASTIGNTGGTTSTGFSSVASISDGVFYVINGLNVSQSTGKQYQIGNFVSVPKQTVILNKYDNTPTYRVGLQISETIIDYVSDTSLLDPAIGASNYQAPGADRYSITLSLVTYPLQLGNDDAFIELMRIENGQVLKIVNDTAYSNLDDYLAKRTFDTNGDFVVNDYPITPTTNNDNGDKYNLKVGKGVSYVQGYRLENQSDVVLVNDRARQTETKNSTSVYVNYGSYFLVDTVKGLFDVTNTTTVDLHCVSTSDINTSNTTTYNSTLVGQGIVRNMSYVQNTLNSNTQSYVYKLYTNDVTTRTLSGNVSSATSNTITLSNGSGAVSSKTGSYDGMTISAISPDGITYTSQIVSYNGATRQANVSPSWVVTPDNTYKFQITFGTKDVESIVTSSGSSVLSSANINEAGKVNGVPTGSTIYTDTGSPQMLFKIGQNYVSNVTSGVYNSTKVFRNKSFSNLGSSIQLQIQLPSNLQNTLNFDGGVGNLAADAIKQNYTVIVTSTTDTANNGPVGSVLDFCTSGNTVNISSDKTTLTLSSTKYKTPLTVSVISKVSVIDGDDEQNVLRTKTLVTGNTSIVSTSGPDGNINSNTFVDLSNAQVYIKNDALVGQGKPQSLYVSDVKKIVKIIDTRSKSVTPSLSMISDGSYDVTSHYIFNNGQKDSYYDHASITLKNGMPVSKGNLLVIFDYYLHSGGDGYFTVKSYRNEQYSQIGTYKDLNGTTFKLTDVIDFRPSRENVTNTFRYHYTTNPSTTDSGTLVPNDLDNWSGSYSYYLARNDLLVLTKDNNFQIIQGTPSINPATPSQPAGSLLLANLKHEPYTAYLPSETPKGQSANLSVNKVQHKRWLMSDISGLQNSINNLEYYTSLNALEQKAQSMQVSDVNGLNRFKNGILVDSFTDYSVADTANKDFSVSIDRLTQQMSASQVVENYPLQPIELMNSLRNNANDANTLGYSVKTINAGTNIFTLPYTTSNVVTQRVASNTVNLNPFSTPVYEGSLFMNPPMDNWVDNTKEPDLLIVDPNLTVYQSSNTLNTLNITNWQTIPGSEYTTVTTNPVTWWGGWQTTSTYASQQQQTTTGYWSKLGSSYTNNNGYITDISIQPYIRPQQVMIKATGLKVNTPVSTWFDGVNVDQYMHSPDSVELVNVSGTFNTDDVIGYYSTTQNKFHPLATVISTYNYPNSSNVRLYISSQFHTTLNSQNTESNIITNAKFDSDGNYVGSSASGMTGTPHMVTVHSSGNVTGIGNGFLDYLGNRVYWYRQTWWGYNNFLQTYGVWKDQNNHPGIFDITYSFNVPKSDTYYIQGAGGYYSELDVWIDGVKRIDRTIHNGVLRSLYLTKGTHTIRIYSNAYDYGYYYNYPYYWKGYYYYYPYYYYNGYNNLGYNVYNIVGLAISDEPWDSLGSAGTNGAVIFSTVQHELKPYSVDTVTTQAGGGHYYTGVTKLSLNSNAPAANSVYVGSTISVTATHIPVPDYYPYYQTYGDYWYYYWGRPYYGRYRYWNNRYYFNYDNMSTNTDQRVTTTKTAKITEYDPITRSVTLDSPVDVSLGVNGTYGDITSTYNLVGLGVNYTISVTDGEHPQLSTDEKGEFVSIFNIPPKTFLTGSRVFRVDNRITPTDSASSTTWAEGTFTASGLSTKSQSLNFTPTISSAPRTFTSTQTRNTLVKSSTTFVQWYNWDPVAQTFIVDSQNYPNGTFINSIKVFFATKPQTTSEPVTLSVVGTDNGYPNGEVLTNSIVTLDPSRVNVSNTPHYLDANTYTEFVFDAPIYIKPDTLYAFILHSSSVEYNVYVAAQNGIAIPSTVKTLPTDETPTSSITKIGANPYVGTLFESQNSMTWTADQTKSMMFIIEQCIFDITKQPKIQLIVPKGLQKRKAITKSIRDFYGMEPCGLSYGNTTKTDQIVDAINLTTTDYVPSNSNINYTYKSKLLSTYEDEGEKSVNPGKFGSPTQQNIYLDDGLGERVLQSNSVATFSMYATLSSSDPYMSPSLADDGTSLYTIQWNVNNLNLSNTVVSVTANGSGYNANTTYVTISEPDVGNGIQATAVANVANGSIQNVYIMNPGEGYLRPPTINIVDSSATPGSGATVSVNSEFDAEGGNAQAKYFTKVVTLAPGNDSQDMRVFFTAYKPAGSQIYVFYRLKDRTDNQLIEDAPWQLMTVVGTDSFSKTRNDLIEYEMAPGVNGVPDNQISYVSTNGQTYNSYYQYALKIVLVTDDTTKVPFLSNLRALALPSGTGM